MCILLIKEDLTDERHNQNVCPTGQKLPQALQMIYKAVCVRDQIEWPDLNLQLPTRLQDSLEDKNRHFVSSNSLVVSILVQETLTNIRRRQCV